jgi:class 3 adenylate cyclase/tetratricopeptide (TPR) repeat protein
MPVEATQGGSVPAKGKEPSSKSDSGPTVADPSATPAAAPAERLDATLYAAQGPPTMPAPETPTPPLPTVFGRYEVRRVLGSGGFGAVYLAHDAQLDRDVAIKVMHGELAHGKNRSDQSLQEARSLARLRHPGIVSVHDVGIHDGRVYIVSDYVDGPTLSQWQAHHRVAWPEAVRIVAALADALAHAHAQRVVHRDVKPGNIILTADGAPVLVDFGLALDDARAGGGEKGIIAGTPEYLSPEQAAGTAHRIDGRTDIYSLGVVLYELLTGRVPFHAGEVLELLRQVCEDEPQPPRQLVSDIPPELGRACLKALAKQQSDRYTTAADFAEELRRILASAAASRSLPQPEAASPGTPRLSTSTPTPMPSSRRRARAAERRQVTVLVCGCAGFESEAYLQLDAEDQARVVHAFRAVCEPVIAQLDGTIVQCNEQGLLACFGYPAAHEDAAPRAGRTGLALLHDIEDLCAQLRQQHQLELAPWVGLHTGPAVVEAQDGAVSFTGEARNIGVRLDPVAAPGQVICTQATRRLLAAQFQCASLGERKIKGLTQPIELFHVQALGEALNPVEAAGPATRSPLTGRDHEVRLLMDRWEQAQEGMGQVVLLIGEPGLGKSRLVYTLKEHVLGQMVEGEVDAPVIEWRCSPHFQNTGFYPAIDFYERSLGFGREEPGPARFERLLHRLQQYDLARPEVVPLWAALLSLPVPPEYPPLSLSPTRQRDETFKALLDWLHTRAARKPVLFIVEDLHWVDASTREFLEQFLAEGLHDRVLTVLTFRPEFKTPWPAMAHQTSLALNRLTRRQVGELIRKKSAGALSDAVIEQIYDRTSGVPLFVEEFTKMVQEVGTGAEALLTREIPATLHDLLMARLDRMETEHELAQLAATLGREFSYDVLAAVAGRDEPTLHAELARLVQAEILYPKGRPPRCPYVFKHALLEDALYNSLVRSRRQQFHRRIGETLEAQFPQTAETQPELLAHHFTEAGLVEKAAAGWLRAGLRSRERSAEREAIGHLTRGLALLDTLDETPERDDRILEFLSALGPAYIAVRGYAAPEVGPVLQRARDLCQRIGEPEHLFGIMLGMWEWRLVRGDIRLCMELAGDGMVLAQHLNDPGMHMEALFMPGVTQYYRGEFAASRAYHDKALAYDDRTRTRLWTAFSGHDGGVTHRCYLALDLWHLGHADQALQLIRDTCALARSLGHPFSLGHAVDFAALLCHNCRLGAEAAAAADEETAIGADQGFQLWHALGTLHKGAALLLQRRPEEALPILLRGLNAFRATGAQLRLPYYFSILGEAYTQTGRFEEADNAFNEGLAVADRNDNRAHEADLHRLKGELLLASSSSDAVAEACFHRAIETAKRQQSKAWELRSTLSLAQLWQRQGRRAEARAALAAVRGTFTEGFATPDLVDAAALLEALA